jgi:aminopeptidase N
MTQQASPSFGQSWPGLVWLPITYFYDTTIRHQLGMDDPRAYFKVVAPHEVAHQWWGHTIGFGSYRDQWMSEGFADMSASLYLQNIYSKEPQRFVKFWEDERELLLERNKEGFRAIDAGPLTLGYRLSNSREGYDIARRLIYPKGAYVLHMLRMMMMDRRSGDQQFKDTMQDFVKTYANRAATTEDFKAIVEKHMTPEMDLDGNHRLDWFFNEYVYGTALPSYKLEYKFDNAPDGVLFNLKLTQNNVDEHFKMLVPIYLEMSDGKLLSLGRARMLGNTSLEQKVPLKGFKEAPKRAVVNYYYDVLAAN